MKANSACFIEDCVPRFTAMERRVTLGKSLPQSTKTSNSVTKVQIIGQDISEIPAGIDENVFDTVSLAEIDKASLELLKCPEVVPSQLLGSSDKLIWLF